MRLISCAKTIPQVVAQTKTETRRLGWKLARPAWRLIVIERNDYRRGGTPVALACVELIHTARERLCDISPDAVVREGFPEMTPREFIAFFCREMRAAPDVELTVLRWRYLREPDLSESERRQFSKLLRRIA